MRGLNADAGFAWDFQDVADLVTEAPPPRLVVNLVPHRIEADDEWLVHSLRQFTVTIELINGGSGVKIPSWASQGIDALRATLVYADTGEAVLPHKGEPPLVGEINPRRPHDGDNHMRLRVAALSYYHARRPFAVRIDADVAPGAPPGLFALSHPVRGVARLPAETKPATKPPSSATPSSAQSPYAVAGPTMAAHAAASRAAPALQPPDRSCHPQMAVVAVLDGDDDDESFDTDDDENMLDDDECPPHACTSYGNVPYPGPAFPQQSYTYTSGADLADELRVQGDMLERVSAQQKFILDELTRMRSSHGEPPPSMLPHADMPLFRGATMCA